MDLSIARLFDRALPAASSATSEERRAARLFVGSALGAGALTLGLAAARLLVIDAGAGFGGPGAVLFFAGLALLALPLLFRATGSPQQAGLGMAAIGVVAPTCMALAEGGLLSEGLYFLTFAPLVAALFSGTRAAAAAALAALAALALVGAIAHGHALLDPRSQPSLHLLGASGGVAFGALLGVTYEELRRRAHRALEENLEVLRRRERALQRAIVEAQQASEAKDRFLATMSHELRTPLNAVVGFSRLTLRKPQGELGARDRKFLERIESNGHHLLSVIDDILDLSKIEAGRQEFASEPVALRELIEDAARAIQPLVDEKGVAVHLELPEGEFVVRADPVRLRQVALNLASNAAKFTERGEIAFSLEAIGGAPTALRVRDTGVGVSPEQLEQIFQPFEQADAGAARSFGGTGLGLAIARSFAEGMGFRLEVESAVGAGSTFTILFR